MEALKTFELPARLFSAISALIKGYPRALLKPDVARLLDVYRSMCQIDAAHILPGLGRTDLVVDPDALPRTTIEYGQRETMAYVASQMPFAYAPLARILSETRDRLPDFRPSSLLDFGTGPGTAIW